jgi:hypothetical protein
MAQPHFLQTCCFVDFPMNADAISDLILAVVAFFHCLCPAAPAPALAIGCGLIGLAAAIGTLHYQYGELFAGPHRFTGLVAASAGFRCWSLHCAGQMTLLLSASRPRGASRSWLGASGW